MLANLFQVQFIHLLKSLYDMFTDLTEEQQLYHSLAMVGNLLLRLGDAGKQFRAQASASGEGTHSVTSHSVSADTILSTSSSVNQIAHSGSFESQGDIFLGSSPHVFEGDGVAKETSSEAALQTATDMKAWGESAIMDGKPTSAGENKDCNLGTEKMPSADANNSTANDSDNSESQGNQEDEVSSARSNSESQVSSSSSLSRPDEGWSISFEQFLASMLTEGALVNYFEKIHDVSDPIARMRNRRLVTRQASVP